MVANNKKSKKIKSKGRGRKLDVQAVKRTLAKVIAYGALFVLAGVGLRSWFSVMHETLSQVLTVGIVLALAYIIFDNGGSSERQ